jgi:MFS family permease
LNSEPPAASGARDVADSRLWALLTVAGVVFLNVIDVTILNVAIPTIQRELGAGEAAIQWLIAGYASVFGILMMTGGRLGDIYGYRRVLAIGLIGFVLSSLACGLATDPLALILARLVQGASAAMMSPQVQSTIQLLYVPKERVAVLGVFGVLGGAAAVAGPLVGGLLIEADLFGLGWRMIFLVNLPFGVLLLFGAMRYLPARRSSLTPHLDVAGNVLVMLLFASLLVPLVEGRALGWPAWCVAMMATSPALLYLVIRYSKQRMARDGSAMLVPSLFAERSFSVGVGMAGLFQATMAGTLFVLTLALQNGLAFSAGEVGIVHVPFAVGVAAGIGVLARKILPRIGPVLIVLGAAVMSVGLGAVTWQIWTGTTGIQTYLPTMLVLGLGCGMVHGCVAPISLSEIDTDYAGAASGTLRSMQEFGAAAGVAIVGGVFLSIGDVADWLRAFAGSAGLTIAILIVISAMALRTPRDLQVFELS